MAEGYETDEIRRKTARPAPSSESVCQLLAIEWNLTVIEIKQLPSYDDCNFFVECSGLDNKHCKYLVKYYNGVESENIDMINGLGELFCVLKRGCSEIDVPCPVKSKSNESVVTVDNCTMACGNKSAVAVRLLTWVEGDTLCKFLGSGHDGTSLWGDVGRAIGIASSALDGFDHPAFHRYHAWDMKQFQGVSAFVGYIEEADIKALVQVVLNSFSKSVLHDAHQFSMSVILGKIKRICTIKLNYMSR